MEVEHWIFLAGIAHLLLASGSLLIPRLLSWNKNLSGIPSLFRQMFWTYAGYILCTNVFFGIISIFGSASLLDHSFLATSVTAFIALYWLARILIQFFYFDRESAPKGIIYLAGEIALDFLFIAFSILYGYAFILNIQ